MTLKSISAIILIALVLTAAIYSASTTYITPSNTLCNGVNLDNPTPVQVETIAGWPLHTTFTVDIVEHYEGSGCGGSYEIDGARQSIKGIVRSWQLYVDWLIYAVVVGYVWIIARRLYAHTRH